MLKNEVESMKQGFQSKDIQKILGIPKQRVEYLALKTPIKPELEKVEGTGRAHIYSFKNAVQFAIAQSMSEVGLGMAEIRKVLERLNSSFVSVRLKTELEMLEFRVTENVVRDLSIACQRFFDPKTEDFIYAVISRDAEGDVSMYVLPHVPDMMGGILFELFDVVLVISLRAIKKRVVDYAKSS